MFVEKQELLKKKLNFNFFSPLFQCRYFTSNNSVHNDYFRVSLLSLNNHVNKIILVSSFLCLADSAEQLFYSVFSSFLAISFVCSCHFCTSLCIAIAGKIKKEHRISSLFDSEYHSFKGSLYLPFKMWFETLAGIATVTLTEIYKPP